MLSSSDTQQIYCHSSVVTSVTREYMQPEVTVYSCNFFCNDQGLLKYLLKFAAVANNKVRMIIARSTKKYSNETKCTEVDRKSQISWNYKERVMAAKLLIRLVPKNGQAKDLHLPVVTKST